MTSDSQPHYLRSELLTHLYRGLPASVIAVLINAAILAFVVYPLFDPKLVYGWLGLIILTTVYRFWSYRKFINLQTGFNENYQLWERRFVIPTVVIAALWGTAGWFFFQANELKSLIILAFVLAGVSGGAVVILSAYRWLAITYVSIMLIPLILNFFLVGTTADVFMASMVLLYLFVNINSIMQTHSRLIENITLKLQAIENERTLKQNESFLNNTGKISKICGWHYDLEKDTFSWTNNIYDIFQISANIKPGYEETINLFDQDSRDTMRTALENLIHHKQEFSQDIKVKTQKNKQIWIRAIGNCFISLDKVTEIYGSFQDITQQKSFEVKLKEVSDLAFAASKAKTDFLANMSHEIRTPLHGILGTLEILKNKQLNEEQTTLLSTVHDSAKNLLHIINEILDLTKIESGALSLHPTRFNIRDTLDDSIKLFKSNADAKGLVLQHFYPAELPETIIADQTKIQQIIQNLLGNALKFTHQGYIYLIATLIQDSEKTPALKIEIKDSGVGIDRGKTNEIFEAFTQEDNSTTRKYGGTGLGLAICKKLANLMRGEIGHSQNDDTPGSIFWFTVPIEIAPGLEQGHPTPPTSLPYKARLFSHDGFIKTVLTNYLASLGYRLDTSKGDQDTGQRDFQVCFIDHNSHVATTSDYPADLDSDTVTIIHIDLNQPVPESNSLNHLVRPIFLANLKALIEKSDIEQSDTMVQPGNRYTGKALIVDDNVINQTVSGEMLKHVGLNVSIASGGQQAIELVEKSRFDFIFMDCQMPEMDGFEATMAIRELEQRHALPRQTIIALTANVMSDDRQHCFEAGMDDFLGKPFTVDQLLALLEKWSHQSIV